jgi:hypothetical protein
MNDAAQQAALGLALLSVGVAAYSLWTLQEDERQRRELDCAKVSSAPKQIDPTSLQASQPSLRYLDEFVSDLTCSALLLETRMYPDAKEITESMAMFDAVRCHIPLDIPEASRHKKHGIICVGDGATPRTASLFAFRTKGWMCYSIDPIARTTKEWESIDRLKIVRAKIEEVRVKLDKAVIILLHAHVSLEATLPSIEAEEILAVVCCPCCNFHTVQQSIGSIKPDVSFHDPALLSVHNEVRIWLDPKLPTGTATSNTGFKSKLNKAPKKTKMVKRIPLEATGSLLVHNQNAEKPRGSGSGNGDEPMPGVGEDIIAVGELLPVLRRWLPPALAVRDSNCPSNCASRVVRVLVLGTPASASRFGQALARSLGEGAGGVVVEWASSVAMYEELLDSGTGGTGGTGGGGGGGGGGEEKRWDLVVDVGLLQSLLQANKRSTGVECTERMARTVRHQMLVQHQMLPPVGSSSAAGESRLASGVESGVFLLVSPCKWVRRPLKLGEETNGKSETGGWMVQASKVAVVGDGRGATTVFVYSCCTAERAMAMTTTPVAVAPVTRAGGLLAKTEYGARAGGGAGGGGGGAGNTTTNMNLAAHCRNEEARARLGGNMSVDRLGIASGGGGVSGSPFRELSFAEVMAGRPQFIGQAKTKAQTSDAATAVVATAMVVGEVVQVCGVVRAKRQLGSKLIFLTLEDEATFKARDLKERLEPHQRYPSADVAADEKDKTLQKLPQGGVAGNGGMAVKEKGATTSAKSGADAQNESADKSTPNNGKSGRRNQSQAQCKGGGENGMQLQVALSRAEKWEPLQHLLASAPALVTEDRQQLLLRTGGLVRNGDVVQVVGCLGVTGRGEFSLFALEVTIGKARQAPGTAAERIDIS